MSDPAWQVLTVLPSWQVTQTEAPVRVPGLLASRPAGAGGPP